jgi:uncharacterized membrane protein
MYSLMLLFRLLHILSGVLWVGGVVMIAVFISPAMRATGPAGGQVMGYLLTKTRLAAYFPAMAGLNVLAGLFLFWRDASGGSHWAGTRSGMTFSIGALAALIAFIIGGAMIGRSMGQIAKILSAAQGPPQGEAAAQMATHQARIMTGTKVVLPLLIIAVITMSIGRYM